MLPKIIYPRLSIMIYHFLRDFVDVHVPKETPGKIASLIKLTTIKRSEMAVEIANQDKRKEELMKTFQKYDREQIMFQNCALRMLMEQQHIIRKQKCTIEKKKHQLADLKQQYTKTTEELEKKQKELNNLKKPKQSFTILCSLCKEKTFNLNNPTNYNRHLEKCKVVQQMKTEKQEKSKLKFKK